MDLTDIVSLDMVKLDLDSTSRDEVLKELVGLLQLDEESERKLYRILKRRQDLGSTGMGRGVAVVYYRSLALSRLRAGFGRSRDGIEFKAIDGKPVHYFFLVIGPPSEKPDQFLLMVAKIFKLAKEPDTPDRLRRLERPEEFVQWLEEKLN